jgi:hypothetical protein
MASVGTTVGVDVGGNQTMVAVGVIVAVGGTGVSGMRVVGEAMQLENSKLNPNNAHKSGTVFIPISALWN